ncbi:sn1-specific diacylglycerol lipase alpha isoform X2 [Contarinia nasturtii]|uniref:sn1-specific diacylglycerol lipase alpha isoform X2 n=1 Tax=Contarinia nasturtii TaxID=265458 RepID=UPI0012D43E0D|nr:sn1-specific diacylglycerol lipase alpha isoform X2 [Contarinia nasturtii]
MPGLIVFRRRWSVGSDDLVVPGAFLFTVHLIWLIILSLSVIYLEYDMSNKPIELLFFYKIGYICILVVSITIELGICIISMRGSILDTAPRVHIHYWLYSKLAMIIVDVTWLTLGVVWLLNYYMSVQIGEAREIMLGLVICNWAVLLSIFITIWCTFDAAGRSWVKMKKYQRSMRESESRFNYKRSGSMNRNWRQRKVIRAYQDSWDHRCRLLFCCMSSSERNHNSFADIARLLSDFFRELDVVPSDVVAGLVLLRKFQKVERQHIVRQKRNGTYEFLSGVPITERTQFLRLNDPKDYECFQMVIHYMHYALSAYGWPMFLMTHSKTGLCQLCTKVRCCCFSCCRSNKETTDIIDDNCCKCNYAAMKRMLSQTEAEVIYTTFHVDVGETPFFVAVDYTKEKIVVSIRGTLSMKDVLTDLNAEGDVLPLEPRRDEWVGHKGMVQAAVYIRNKLEDENLIQRAQQHNLERKTDKFGLVLVGHSLGAGTAAILSILLKPQYPSILCFSYSPPGGLLSMPAVEYSKSFITSVVVGKDVVPRIGLYQMEALRADLINAIKRSVDPKWKTITCSMICCCNILPTSVLEMSSHDAHVNNYEQERYTARKASTHPNDSSIALTLHNPLYPPGRIIHIVRHHPSPEEQVLKTHEPVYQAIWVDNNDFDEVLISPAMIQDHMPDTVLAALNKVITTHGPRKPQRQSSNVNLSIESDLNMMMTPNNSQQVCLETSFTSLQSPGEPFPLISCSSKASSMAGSLFSRSQLNSILHYDGTGDEHLIARSTSAVPSDATTVILADHSYRTKSVAFDIKSSTVSTTSPSPNFFLKSILHRQTNEAKRKVNVEGSQSRRPPPRRIEFAKDDCLGMAPLASPETLSEISSISSRTSLAFNLASSIENYLHRINTMPSNANHIDLNDCDLIESQLHTPKVMRRAPKITGNLSTCADDWQSVDKYKRMGKIFITNPVPLLSSNSSGDSFESTHSLTKSKCCTTNPTENSSRSADNLDNDTPIKASSINTNKLTMSDSAILDGCNSKCPRCPCTRSTSSLRVPCCRRNDHSWCMEMPDDPSQNQTSSSDTYHSAFSSLATIETYPLQRPLPCGVLESHFPVYSDNAGNEESTSLLPASVRSSKIVRVDNNRHTNNGKKDAGFKRYANDYENERRVSRNDSLPLLANLVERSSPNSFNRRRNHTVYPITSSPPRYSPSKRTESNV